MISIPAVTGLRYLVLGYAKSGVAAAAALKASGAQVMVWDDQEASRTKAAADGHELANPTQLDFKSLTAMVMAPGIPLTHPAPHPAVLKCSAAGVPVISDIDLLFAACPKARYVGITGTNGKSTTTALITHMLAKAGLKVQMGGNIGTAALSLEPLGADGVYVLELSSYQLDLLHSNPLGVAVWLNVTPDHFERHGDMQGYIAAKMKIIRTEGPQTLILGTDEPEMLGVLTAAQKHPQLTIRQLSIHHDVAAGIRAQGQKLFLTGGAEAIDINACKTLPGPHNAQNAAAAVETGLALGLTRAQIIEGLATFPGLAHRQELVAEIKGVRFVNDSKATNADAASKALACYDPIYWIIGGRPKVGGLAGLETYAPRIAHAFIIGEASADFAGWCASQKIPFTLSGTLDAALEQAAATAWKENRKEAVVLLSPACASFDQFTSFEARGQAFATAVHTLEQGV
jgi:UDP-N-acetylmuramoylalanine--D-glutamate ligase